MLSNNKCLQGLVPFCKEYLYQQENCIECYDDFILLENLNGKKMCLQLSDKNNCLAFNDKGYSKIECIRCKKDHFLADLKNSKN